MLTNLNQHFSNYYIITPTYTEKRKCQIFYPTKKIWNFSSYKYKFYDVVNNQIKNCEIFLPLSQFKYNGFEFANLKRTTVFRAVIDGEIKKIKYSLKWEQKNFDFDAHQRDINALFVFDKSKNRFVSNKCYTKGLYIVHNEYLKHGKKPDVNDFYIDYFIRRAAGSENDAVIVSNNDYQKIPWNRQYLTLIIQTARTIYPKQHNILHVYKRYKTTNFNNITVCTYANIYYSKSLPWQVKVRL